MEAAIRRCYRGGELTESAGGAGIESQQALFRGRSLGMSALTFGARYLF